MPNLNCETQCEVFQFPFQNVLVASPISSWISTWTQMCTVKLAKLAKINNKYTSVTRYPLFTSFQLDVNFPVVFSHDGNFDSKIFEAKRNGRYEHFHLSPILSSSPGKCANSKSRCGCWRGFDEIRASISSTLFRFARRHLFFVREICFFFSMIRSRGRFNFPGKARFSISISARRIANSEIYL